MTEAVEFNEMEEKNALAESARKLYLMGLGVASYTAEFVADHTHNTRENLGDLATRLQERGEETDKKTRERVSEQTQARQEDIRSRGRRVESEVGDRFESVLHALNIPSRSDISSLSNKVTRLNKKVNELSKAE